MERAATELRLRGVVLELESDSDEAATHFLDQCGGRDGKLEEEGGFSIEAVVLDAEPDVTAPTVAKDGADNHCLGGARRSGRRSDGGWGGRLRGVFFGLVIVVLGMWVVEVVTEGGAEAFLGGGGGGGCGGVDWRSRGRVDASEKKPS